MKQSRHWTKDEEQFLKDNWKTMTREEMGNKLNRTILAVTRRVQQLGLIATYVPKKHSTIEFIRQHKHLYGEQIAKLLGVTGEYVRRLAREANIKLATRRITTIEEDKDIHHRFQNNRERVRDIHKDYPHLRYSVVYSRAHYG